MKYSSLLLGFSLLIASPIYAQDDLVPATTDDIQNFDDQVSNTDSPSDSTDSSSDTTTSTKQRKDNFGAKVSAEAKRLKSLPKEERTKMGQWVSAQRRQNTVKKQHGKSSSDSSVAGMNSTMGGSADARSSAPGQIKKNSPRQGGSNRPNKGH